MECGKDLSWKDLSKSWVFCDKRKKKLITITYYYLFGLTTLLLPQKNPIIWQVLWSKLQPSTLTCYLFMNFWNANGIIGHPVSQVNLFSRYHLFLNWSVEYFRPNLNIKSRFQNHSYRWAKKNSFGIGRLQNLSGNIYIEHF